ncbi:hyaluronidase-3 isoform X2 [Amia ocellicauda]|uniref:hyaluronidase-3 isoform X2 n=1 Tax=Amia ocellicauda TaxID=2972642 RepID=UPI0034643AAC
MLRGGSALPLLVLLLGAWGVCANAGATTTSAGAFPIIHCRPFVVVWNMPTEQCQERHGVSIDLSTFDIIQNRQQRFLGQNMTIFYRNKLGLYPYISQDGREVNGGVPQQATLEEHLRRASGTIRSWLRPNFGGLAVIDWEDWRPLWVRNWDTKKKYQHVSMRLARQQHPQLPVRELAQVAQEEFETGARAIMERTLQLGVGLRPSGLWGYYGFPDCYNYYKQQSSTSYTGHCHPSTAQRNDRLDWLWQNSTAIYPSIYLPHQLASREEAGLFVRYRVLEAMRVASTFRSARGARPVLPYARVAFAHTLQYLGQRNCEVLRDYVDSVLGGYVRKLTSAASQCSQSRCSGNGRCARQDRDSSASLTLPSARSPGAPPDLDALGSSFICVCYPGWTGQRCQNRLR